MSNLKIKTIPKGWKIHKIGSLGYTYNGLTGKNKDDFRVGKPYIPYMNIFSDFKININKFDLVKIENGENQNKVKYGDILFTTSSETPKEVGMSSVLLDEVDEVYLNSFCFGFRLHNFKIILPEFARYLFRSSRARKDISNLAQGSTRFNLTKRFFLDLDLLVPTIQEQNKIAEILSTVDEDIEKVDEIIQKADKLKKGLMQELLTKGIRTKINSVCKINSKQIDPKKSPDKEFNYIDIASVKDYKVNEVKKFLGKDAPSRARREIIENDIIISTVRPNLRGFTFITNLFNYYLCSTGFCVLRCDKKILPKYLYYIVLQDKFVYYLIDKTTGSNYPAVNSSAIGEYVFKLPPIKEQKQIAEILSAIDDKIEINKQIKNKLTQLKKGLMNDLLSGRVRVK